MVNRFKVHACKMVRSPVGRRATIAGVPLCETTKAREFSSELTPEREVTCLICLYHLRRYMPLSKLREHQRLQRTGVSRARW